MRKHAEVSRDPSKVHCTSCGFVIKENVIETGPEWRSFSNEEKDERSRTGLPTSVAIHDMGLATIIGGENKDAAKVAHRRDEVERRANEDLGQKEPGPRVPGQEPEAGLQ